MNHKIITLTCLILLAAFTSKVSGEPQKCGGADIANGPFNYTNGSPTEATFSGTVATSINTSFTVTAPSPNPKTATVEVQDVFAGEGNTPTECASTADALIAVLGIVKIGDASGNAIEPVNIGLDTPPGTQIKGAFVLAPIVWNDFAPGDSQSVTVTVSNPNIDSSYYGQYAVKLAAKADAYGIGVGEGMEFILNLYASSSSDIDKPVVSVTKPTGDEILGVIPIEIQAFDPITSGATGLVDMSAKISSAGNTVANVPITLAKTPDLPVLPNVTVTGKGIFTPTGGSDTAGDVDHPFTSSSRSGIGSYTIVASATDGAGNIGTGSKTFKVNYDVSVTRAFSPPNCQTSGNAQCTGQFEFTVKRSNITSDGAPMFDQTVVVKLVKNSDHSVKATHSYGIGAVMTNVQIDTDGIYKTHFKRGDIGASSSDSYHMEIFFYDVDNTLLYQGTSGNISF